MTTAKRFEDLDVWQGAKELTNLFYIYSTDGAFSRASVTRSNIVDGFEGQTQSKFIQYLGGTKGSAGEVHARLHNAHDQGYVSEADLKIILSLAEMCSKQLAKFIQYLKSQPNARRMREDGVHYDV